MSASGDSDQELLQRFLPGVDHVEIIVFAAHIGFPEAIIPGDMIKMSVRVDNDEGKIRDFMYGTGDVREGVGRVDQQRGPAAGQEVAVNIFAEELSV